MPADAADPADAPAGATEEEPATRAPVARPGTGPPSRAARNVVVTLTIVFTASAWTGDLLLSYLVDRHPALFITLNARSRNLVVAKEYLDWWTFFGIGLARLIVSDPLFFLLGRWYGDAAVRWVERRAPTYGQMFRAAERWFGKASALVVAVAPNNFVCMFAGSAGMSIPVFVASNVGGTVVRLVVLWFVGDVFDAPLDWLRELVTEHRLPVLVLSAVVLAFSIWSERRHGGTDLEVLDALDEQAAAGAAEGPEPDADR